MPLPIRIAADTLPALIVGGVLTAVAISMSLNQWRTHRRLLSDSKLDEAGYAHAERQIKRRLTVAALMFVIGILIPLGDQLDFFFKQNAGLFFIYWMGVLLLVFFLVLLALGDMLSTMAYTRRAGVRLRMARREIEDDIRRYRASQNGHAGESESESE